MSPRSQNPSASESGSSPSAAFHQQGSEGDGGLIQLPGLACTPSLGWRPLVWCNALPMPLAPFGSAGSSLLPEVSLIVQVKVRSPARAVLGTADQLQVQVPVVPLPGEPPEFPHLEMLPQEQDLPLDQPTASSSSPANVVLPGLSSLPSRKTSSHTRTCYVGQPRPWVSRHRSSRRMPVNSWTFSSPVSLGEWPSWLMRLSSSLRGICGIRRSQYHQGQVLGEAF